MSRPKRCPQVAKTVLAASTRFRMRKRLPPLQVTAQIVRRCGEVQAGKTASFGFCTTLTRLRNRKSITSRLPSSHLRTPSHSRRASGSGGAGPGGGGGAPRGGGGAMELGPVAGFHSKHARYISKDRELLKMLENAIGKGGDEGA